MIERITLQWLAGFFDGEGSVCCTRGKQKWRILVVLTQNDRGLLEAIRTKFPEFKFCKARHRSGAKGFDITAEGGACSVFLEAVKPFVIRKLIDVETGLEFCETIRTFTKGKRRNLGLTEEQHGIRATLVEKMKLGRAKDSIN